MDKSNFRASDIEAIPGHRNYYRSMKSGIIYFKDATTPKFSTKETTIGRARKVVELRKLEITGLNKSETRRKLEGVSNPLIEEIYLEMTAEMKVGWEKATQVAYRKDWNNSFAPFFGKDGKARYAADFTTANLKKYRLWYLETRGTKYAEKAVIHLGVLAKFMVSKRYILELPDLSVIADLQNIVNKNARRKKPGRVYEDQEIYNLLEAARTISKLEYLRSRAVLGVLLGVRCGLRKMEAMGLLWEKVDLRKRVFWVWSTKNKKWREIPMTEEVFQAFMVQAAYSATNSVYVFPMPTDRTKFVSGQQFDHIWMKVKDKASIKDWNVKDAARFHDLRHTFASKTANDGWPPKVACEILDMSLKVYDSIYAKASSAKKAEMMNLSFGAPIEKKRRLTKNKEEK